MYSIQYDLIATKIIEIARKYIWEKTGIIVPAAIISNDEPYGTKQQVIVQGCYYQNYKEIDLKHSLFEFSLTNREFSKMLNGQMDSNPLTDDQVISQLKTHFNNGKFMTAISVIIHEYGHYIHDLYLRNKTFGLPISESNRPEKAKQNDRENFAVAFTEYVTDSIPHKTIRYQRIRSIIESLQKFDI